MAVSHYLLYELECVIDDVNVLYYGITGVLVGVSDRQALFGRRKWHEECPVKCLRGRDESPFTLKILKSNLRKADALVDEVT
jgi:hypothetical protein